MFTGPADCVRWLFIDLDSYFASCEQQARPELRGKPVAVVPLAAETTCCLAASYQAKKYGVKTGTLVADARVMCPGIIFVLARHDLYTLYHKTIVEAVDTCLPIDAILGIDEMICELTGSQQELSNALALADKIKIMLRQRVGETLTCSIGLAPNRFLAKVASDMNKPNGVSMIRRKDLPYILHPLKLRDFPGIGPKMEERLHSHGIYSVQELCALPLEKMIRLWGSVVGERFYLWLRGENVMLAETVHRSIGHQHVLEPEFRNSTGSWAVTKKLLIKAAVRLRKEGYYARKLALQMRFTGSVQTPGDRPTDGFYWDKEVKLEETQGTLTLLAGLRGLWATLPQGRPFRVGVTLSDLIPANRHQLSLLVNPARENLDAAMDRINAKFGKETISIGDLPDDAEPAPARIAFSRVPDLEEF
jgi:DNA polymerase-4